MAATATTELFYFPPGPVTVAGGHPRRWTILGVLLVGLLVVVLDNTVLNVALKVLADPEAGLGASAGELQWAINSYTLAFAGLLLTFGILGDRIGRRRMLLFGLITFAVFSLASAYAQEPGQLILARALMGVGGAAVMPSTLSIIANVFDPKERGKAIGVWTASAGLAVAVGPLVGGLLLEHFWWGSVFLINVPIIVGGVVAVLLVVPESRDPHPGRIDLVGVVLSIAGLVALVYGIIQGGDSGAWDRWDVGGAVIAGVGILAAFVLWELHVDQPSVDVRLFRNPRFSGAGMAIGSVFFAPMGVFFFLAFYLQGIRDYTPLQAGLLMLPFAVSQVLFAPRSAALVRSFGLRAVCTAGLVMMAGASATYALVGETTPIVLVLVALFVQGAGLAIVMPTATETLIAAMPRERAGTGSAVGNTIRQVGGALGVAVVGSLLTAVYRTQLEPALAGMGPQAAAARESVAAAHGIAAHAGLPRLAEAADAAFVSAVHVASLGAAAVAGLGAVAVFLTMRSSPGAGHGSGPGAPPHERPLVDIV